MMRTPKGEAMDPRKAIRSMDPMLSESDHAYNYAIMLLASAHVGPNTDKVAALCKLPRRIAREHAAKIRKAGVWHGGKICHGGWFDNDGGTAFWLDVACCQGLLTRQRGKGRR